MPMHPSLSPEALAHPKSDVTSHQGKQALSPSPSDKGTDEQLRATPRSSLEPSLVALGILQPSTLGAYIAAPRPSLKL